MKDNKKKLTVSTILVIALIVMVTGVTFAFFNYTRTGAPNVVQVGRIYFNSTQSSGNDNAITLTNVFPIAAADAGTDTDNTGTVEVTITGDTMYSEGIEYQITFDQVSNTVNSKTVPINFIATASNIGTPSNDYFTDRGKVTSVYDLTASGEITEDKEVLKGYIKPDANGIDGTLTIKAYLDSSKIAISDTYDPNAVAPTPLPGNEDDNSNPSGKDNKNMQILPSKLDNEVHTTDEYGTTTEWVNGRTVFTTEEWQNLSVSFKIRVEAQEGLWIEEVPTIDSCQDCVFAYRLYDAENSENNWIYGESGTVLTSSDYTNNYEDLVNAGHNFFLGMKLDGTGKITNAYACGIKGEAPNLGTAFCVEGSTDGSTYTANTNILNPLYGPYEEDPEAGNGYGCLADISYLRCHGAVIAAAFSDGYALVEDGSSECGVDSFGPLGCAEY